MFGKMGCSLSALFMYWSGCTNIYILIALSYSRYEDLRRQMLGLGSPTVKDCCLKILVCILLGLFWASLPLLGWSYYSPEGLGTSCSVEWNEKSFNVLSYNITILITVFLIPLILLIYINVLIIRIVIYNSLTRYL